MTVTLIVGLETLFRPDVVSFLHVVQIVKDVLSVPWRPVGLVVVGTVLVNRPPELR